MEKLTIGQLKALISELPDDMEVLQRSKDIKCAEVQVLNINFKRIVSFQITTDGEDCK